MKANPLSKYSRVVEHHCSICSDKITKGSTRCRVCGAKNRTSPMSKESREKIGKANLSEKNGMWKGDKVKYISLHIWIRGHKPKSLFCERCGKVTDRLDLANISGEYKRDIMDFRWLCRKCHMAEDGRLDRFKNFPHKDKPKNGKNVICLNCGKEYYAPRFKISITKFCCRNCKDKYGSKVKNG
jgi:formylmethanofuran dehydrogenase subunit E